MIACIVLFALFGPVLSNHTFQKQELAFVNIPPRLELFVMEDGYIYVSRNLKPIDVASDGSLVAALPRIKEDLTKKLRPTTITVNRSRSITANARHG